MVRSTREFLRDSREFVGRALRVTGLPRVPAFGERGAGLVETLVGLAIVATVAVALMSGLTTAKRGSITADEHSTAESIAKSHIEYIRTRVYSVDTWSYTVTSLDRTWSQKPSWWDTDNPSLLPGTYTSYSVSASATDFDVDGDGTTEVPGDDEGIRCITVAVYRADDPEPVIVLENYRVDL